MQQMDYSTEEAANEFTIAVFNPSGDTMVAGRQDALHAFHFNAKQGVWEEAGGKQVRPGGPLTLQSALGTLSAPANVVLRAQASNVGQQHNCQEGCWPGCAQ